MYSRDLILDKRAHPISLAVTLTLVVLESNLRMYVYMDVGRSLLCFFWVHMFVTMDLAANAYPFFSLSTWLGLSDHFLQCPMPDYQGPT